MAGALRLAGRATLARLRALSSSARCLAIATFVARSRVLVGVIALPPARSMDALFVRGIMAG